LTRKLRAPIVLDRWQAILMRQRLQSPGIRTVEYEFGGDGRRKLFGVLLNLVRSARLRARPHDEFRRELLGLEVQETSAGWRVDHRPGRHDDHVVAVALAVAEVAQRPTAPPDVLAGNLELMRRSRWRLMGTGGPRYPRWDNS
jgi:hypothetical protein